VTEAGRLRAGYAVALLFCATLGYLLLRIPIQTTDSFVNILLLDRPFGQVVAEGVQGGYVRPGLWASFKIVYDLSRGALFEWFRWTHVLQASLVLVLFTTLVRPVTKSAAIVFPLALAVLIGHHTFAWTLREAFPVNAFLTMVWCCGLAACLSFGGHRWWTDVAAVVLFIVAATTVESGLLVGGILIVSYALGLRGLSKTGVAAIAVLILGYFVLRFGFLDAATPALNEREAGFGFTRYDGGDIERMFTGRETLFHVYNVISSALGTLLAEPRDGVFRLTRSIVRDGAPDVRFLIGFVSSTLATGLIARYIWARRDSWRRFELDRGDRIVALFVLVLLANSAISFGYTKDVIMSPAGFFFAAAFAVACTHYVDGLWRDGVWPQRGTAARTSSLVLLLMLSVTWSIRALGLHAGLTQTAFKVREQWAYVDEYVDRRYHPVPPKVEALKKRLQNDAVVVHPTRPELREGLTSLFEMD